MHYSQQLSQCDRFLRKRCEYLLLGRSSIPTPHSREISLFRVKISVGWSVFCRWRNWLRCSHITQGIIQILHWNRDIQRIGEFVLLVFKRCSCCTFLHLVDMNTFINPCHPILSWSLRAACMSSFPGAWLLEKVILSCQAYRELQMIVQRSGSPFWSLSHFLRSLIELSHRLVVSSWLKQITWSTVSLLARHWGHFEWFCHFHNFSCLPTPQMPDSHLVSHFSSLHSIEVASSRWWLPVNWSPTSKLYFAFLNPAVSYSSHMDMIVHSVLERTSDFELLTISIGGEYSAFFIQYVQRSTTFPVSIVGHYRFQFLLCLWVNYYIEICPVVKWW